MARAVAASVGEYVSRINRVLAPSRRPRHTVLDLFAGCGGLSLGFESAGFRSAGIESDARCCETYNANLRGSCENGVITPDTEIPDADVVVGGPPCQPFSVFGRQEGVDDPRNGFPSFVSAVRRARPRMWMFENVRGMMYRNRGYLESVLAELRGLGYAVDCRMLNAAGYGVPQNRLRVIAVGHRGGFAFPEGGARPVTAGEAVGDTARTCGRRPKFLTPNMDKYVAVYERKSQLVTPRDLHLDRPARTVTCRNLAGATSDMHRVRLPDGRRRRLTVGEGARLQSFPDWFRFAGTETDAFNQIGNAVPPLFARALALSVAECLAGRRAASKIAARCRGCRAAGCRVLWTQASDTRQGVGIPRRRDSRPRRRGGGTEAVCAIGRGATAWRVGGI